jgi:hypothetical protein
MAPGHSSTGPRASLAAALAVLAAATVASGAGCVAGALATPVAFDDPALGAVAPGTLVPGSRVVATGTGFVPEYVGPTWLRLRGTFSGHAVDLRLPAEFVDPGRVEADFGGAAALGLPALQGIFAGDATVEIDNRVDHRTHRSAPLPLSLEVRSSLAPLLDRVFAGPVFVNDPIAVEGDGLLLGGAEGQTVAVVSGCFRPRGATSCTLVGPTEVPVVPDPGLGRARGAFAFDPHLAGIEPGTLEGGVVQLVNRHGPAAGEAVIAGNALPGAWDVQPPTIFGLSPATASLGQYVDVDGGGFVGRTDGVGEADMVTSFDFAGTYTPTGGGGRSVAFSLLGEWVSGRLVRYVLNEHDELGQVASLRDASGRLDGTIKPVVLFAGVTVTGAEVPVRLELGRVRQVVWLNFQTSYQESLRHFGLYAVDQQIRARVLEVAQRDYAGVSMLFRLDAPTDFALYSEVDIQGPDPNRLGYLGYDNTPGKDVGNQRLYDRIGGDNALTREDGYPGYGGVFVESLFGFSLHPGSLATESPLATSIFDQVFDPFRPDRGGHPVTSEELAASGVPAYAPGDECPTPGGGRQRQLACAVWVLGGLIGTTLTHEVGHSLGLADPFGVELHNPGDEPNRLMDAGAARPFTERAEILGAGPARFCGDEYDYLRQILPVDEPPPAVERPPCF